MIKHCSLKRILRSGKGFTLVELLVVISIISILAGTVFIVINPATQQRKAKEAVLKAKTSQLCLALNACGAVKDDATLCDTFAKMGATDPSGDPVTSAYAPVASNPNPATAVSTVTITGTLTTGTATCSYECSFNFNDGTIGKFQKVATADCL